MEFGKLVKVKIGEINPPKRINWNERQLKMSEEIIRNYNTNVGEIIISNDYKIIDGNCVYEPKDDSIYYQFNKRSTNKVGRYFEGFNGVRTIYTSLL